MRFHRSIIVTILDPQQSKAWPLSQTGFHNGLLLPARHWET